MTLLHEVFQTLFDHYGPQHWWPGDSPLEIMIGAVLVQNTSWKNVEKAIANLREGGLLDFSALCRVSAAELAETIRPAGYFQVKAKRLLSLVQFIATEFDGDLERMFATPLDSLRSRLLAVHGIGPETADAILLYAGKLPTFVVDTYAARVLMRHGWIDGDADYYSIQSLFHDQLPVDAALFNEYHALLVQVGKEFCGKWPACHGCPLAPLLPAGGPVSIEE